MAPEHIIPDSVRLSFYLGAAVFFVAVLWAVLRSKEYSPEELATFEENQALEGMARERRTAPEFAANGSRHMRAGGILLVAGTLLSAWLASAAIYQVMILSAGLGVAGALLIASGLMQLAWVQSFSWFALFAMWIYTTAAVTSHELHRWPRAQRPSEPAGDRWTGPRRWPQLRTQSRGQG